MSFDGFDSRPTGHTPFPDAFFGELLPQIDHLGELKVTLYIFWRLNRMEGTFRYLRPADLEADDLFMRGMGKTKRKADAALKESLERATVRGTLLKAELELEEGSDTLYFLNSPKGRAGVEGLKKGKWRPDEFAQTPIELNLDRPNIFRLYETNIGPLTPMIADALRDAEDTYPEDWIPDAFRIAVENNVRRWRYIEAILRSWQEEGRDDRTDRRRAQEDVRKYTQGKFSEFIEH